MLRKSRRSPECLESGTVLVEGWEGEGNGVVRIGGMKGEKEIGLEEGGVGLLLFFLCRNGKE